MNMKQYTRIYTNAQGEITHVATQGTPFAPGYDPLPTVEANRMDVELDVEVPANTDHARANLIKRECIVEDGELVIDVDKPPHEREFTLRRVTRAGVIRPHRRTGDT